MIQFLHSFKHHTLYSNIYRHNNHILDKEREICLYIIIQKESSTYKCIYILCEFSHQNTKKAQEILFSNNTLNVQSLTSTNIYNISILMLSTTIMIFALKCSACQGDTKSDNQLPDVLSCYVTNPLTEVQLSHPSLMTLSIKYLSHANEKYPPKIFLIIKCRSCLESYVK
jgi:hypothetical protein